MPRLRRPPSLLAAMLAVVLAACDGLPSTAGIVGADGQAGPASSQAGTSGVALAGVVRAPSALVAAAGNRYALSALGDRPLGDAEVFVATPDGRAYAGLATTKTDAEGRFTLPGVPARETCLIMARAQTRSHEPVMLRTLASALSAGTPVTLTVATTFLAASLTDGKAFGQLDRAAHDKAVALLASRLAEADLALLVSDRRMADWLAVAAARDAALAEAIGALRLALAQPVPTPGPGERSPTPAPTPFTVGLPVEATTQSQAPPTLNSQRNPSNLTFP